MKQGNLRHFRPALLWLAGILVLTLLPGSYIPKPGSFWNLLSPDKLVHLFLFGVLAWLISKGLEARDNGIVFARHYLIVMAVAVILAFATEILQYLLPIGRSGNLYDAIADVAGSALGILLFNFYKKKFKK
ncbi:hypothetical protein MASR1M74_22370 [Lentimicrobium sp.]